MPVNEPLWVDLAKQAPYMVLMVAIVYMFLRFIEQWETRRAADAKKLEEERTNNAKQLEEMRQKHDSEINAMWASAIKTLVDEQNKTAKAISEALAEHEKASRDRYERMGITKELLVAAKEQLSKS